MIQNKLKKRRIDSYTEKRILTAMIVSKDFLAEVNPLIERAYFQSNYGRTISDWCLEFYDSYQQAPFEHIQDIFDQRSKDLGEDVDLVKDLLIDISDKYEIDVGINVPYMVDKTIEFFKKRELEITTGNMKVLLDKNDLEGAEDQILQFNKIAKVSADWSNPFDDARIEEVFAEDNRLFQLTGDIGRYTGAFDRGWLIAIAAPFKSGKTWILQEIAIEAMFKKLKVVFISLEMHERDMNNRIYKRLTGTADPDGGEAVYPCFDCFLNQSNTCKKNERACKIGLLDEEEGTKPEEFNPKSLYVPCTYCKDNPEFRKNYVMDTWFETFKRPPFSERYVKNHLKTLSKQFSKYFRFKKYPRFSANISDVMRDLDILEKVDDYVPDIIVIDYADILKPESGASEGTAQLDDTWKTLSRLAGERHAIVFTASQVNRGALSKDVVEQQDLAMWIGKLGHVDAMFSLNQTNEDKRNGIMRLGTLVKRFDEFDSQKTCQLIQNLKFGQFCLDSHY